MAPRHSEGQRQCPASERTAPAARVSLKVGGASALILPSLSPPREMCTDTPLSCRARTIVRFKTKPLYDASHAFITVPLGFQLLGASIVCREQVQGGRGDRAPDKQTSRHFPTQTGNSNWQSMGALYPPLPQSPPHPTRKQNPVHRSAFHKIEFQTSVPSVES